MRVCGSGKNYIDNCINNNGKSSDATRTHFRHTKIDRQKKSEHDEQKKKLYEKQDTRDTCCHAFNIDQMEFQSIRIFNCFARNLFAGFFFSI